MTFPVARVLIGSLSNDVFEPCTSPGSGLFELFGRDFEQILWQIVSVRVKTLSNTNLVASRNIKEEKGSLPVPVPLLKLPYTDERKLMLVTLRTYSVN